MRVVHGHSEGLGIALSNLTGLLRLEYAAGRGIGDVTSSNPPTFSIPFLLYGKEIVAYGLPLVFKVEPAILIKLTAAAKNTVMEGGFEFNFGGSTGFSAGLTGDLARASTFVKTNGNYARRLHRRLSRSVAVASSLAFS